MELSWYLLATLFLVTVLGSVVQGVSGMGYGLVTVPLFMWVFGPLAGVSLANITSPVNALLLTIAQRRNINWKIWGQLLLSALPGIFLTIFALSFLSQRLLSICLGTLMLIVVTASLFAPRFPPLPQKPAAVGFGFLAGVLMAAVAQAGPAFAAYAQATRWKQWEFAATIQPVAFLIGPICLVTRYCFHAGHVGPIFDLHLLFPLLGAIAVRVALSRPLARLIKPKVARYLAITIGWLGGGTGADRRFVGITAANTAQPR